MQKIFCEVFARVNFKTIFFLNIESRKYFSLKLTCFSFFKNHPFQAFLDTKTYIFIHVKIRASYSGQSVFFSFFLHVQLILKFQKTLRMFTTTVLSVSS